MEAKYQEFVSGRSHWNIVVNLILTNGYKNVAEIGVWWGKLTERVLNSSAHKVVENYWAIDSWNTLEGEEWKKCADISMETWDNKYKTVCKLMRYYPALRVVRMPSKEAATMFWRGYFDLVYIDACHFYDAVTEDIKAWEPLVRGGGVIAGHDYGSCADGTGEKCRCEVTQAVDDYFGKENVNVFSRQSVWWVRK